MATHKTSRLFTVYGPRGSVTDRKTWEGAVSRAKHVSAQRRGVYTVCEVLALSAKGPTFGRTLRVEGGEVIGAGVA